jgi:hypothetical protein
MYSITENTYCSQLSSVVILLKPEPNCFTSYNTRKGLCSLSLCAVVLQSSLPPTCLLVTVNEARSYFSSTILVTVTGWYHTKRPMHYDHFLMCVFIRVLTTPVSSTRALRLQQGHLLAKYKFGEMSLNLADVVSTSYSKGSLKCLTFCGIGLTALLPLCHRIQFWMCVRVLLLSCADRSFRRVAPPLPVGPAKCRKGFVVSDVTLHGITRHTRRG